MNKKGKFIAVVNIRSFESMDNGQKVTRWAVKYLCEFNYPHKDGSTGKQQILAEVYYDENPNMQVGPIEDPTEYEMQFFFKVRQGTSKKGEPYAIQDIILQKASQSVI